MAIEIRAAEARDAPGDLALMHQSFTYTEAQARRYRESRLDETRVAVDDGDLLASLRFTREGQWFGGRLVPVALVHGVKTAPEARGRRVGTTLAEHVLRELRADGVALCTLDPSTTAAYRRQGYEIAAASVRHAVPVSALPTRSPLAIERWNDDDLDEVESFYRQIAAGDDGLLARSREWWHERVLHDRDGPVYRYLVRGDDGVEAYIVHTQPPVVGESPVGSLAFDVDVRDFMWRTPDAAISLLAYVASHRVIADRLRWTGPRTEPLAVLMDWERVAVAGVVPWMSRMVDVHAALTRRGYPTDVCEVIEIAYSDPLLANHPGAVRIEVADGKCRVEPCRRAVASVDIGAFTAIYTGWLSPAQAARTGRLADADTALVDALTRVFPPGSPWISDTF